MRYIIDTEDMLEDLKDIAPEKRGEYLRVAFRSLHEGKGNYPWVTKIKSTTPKNGVYSDAFESFWQEYPKKVGKGGAFKSWLKTSYSQVELLQLCLKALRWQKQLDQWNKNNGEFIPNPQTYLNQCRWEDDCPPELNPDKEPEYYTDIDGIRRKK